MIINDEWRLEADELNVVLMRKKSKEHRLSNKNGEDSYECFYYGTIAYALQAMIEKDIKGTGLKVELASLVYLLSWCLFTKV